MPMTGGWGKHPQTLRAYKLATVCYRLKLGGVSYGPSGPHNENTAIWCDRGDCITSPTARTAAVTNKIKRVRRGGN